jgi:hypothetical protein
MTYPLPWYQAAITGQIPGAIPEGLDPSMLAAPPLASKDERLTGGVPTMAAADPGPAQPPRVDEPLPAIEPLPDYMAGINQAYAANEALGAEQAQKRKLDVGKFLLSWAGHLGDNLTGNPVYSKQLLRRLELEDEGRRKTEEQMRLRHALINAGVPLAQIPLLLTNPEAIGSQFATRLQTRTVDEGSSVYTPDPSGRANVFTAPKTFSEGADVIQSPALNSTLGLPPVAPGAVQVPSAPRRIDGLRTEAEQYADTVAPRSSKGWRSAVSDYVLKANGPTANAHDRDIWGQRLSTTRRGQDLTDRRARRGQDITDRRVRGSAGYQGRGRPGRGDLIGPVYQRGNKRVQYSKKAGGYVDLATGQKVN